MTKCEPGKIFFKINSTLPFLALNNKSYKNLHFPLLHLAVRKPGAKFCFQMLLFVLARSFFFKKKYIFVFHCKPPEVSLEEGFGKNKQKTKYNLVAAMLRI